MKAERPTAADPKNAMDDLTTDKACYPELTAPRGQGKNPTPTRMQLCRVHRLATAATLTVTAGAPETQTGTFPTEPHADTSWFTLILRPDDRPKNTPKRTVRAQ